MTRINVVPVEELHTKQLHGEYVELPCVFTHAHAAHAKGRWPLDPGKYVLGPGHVAFFMYRLHYLAVRYDQICRELRMRDFKLSPRDLWEEISRLPEAHRKDYIPTEEAIALNRERIEDRLASMRKRGII